KKFQSTLNFPNRNNLVSKSTTCPECHMTYYEYISKEKELHMRYHARYNSGIPWPPSLSTKVVREFMLHRVLEPKQKGFKRVKSSTVSIKAEVVSVDKNSKRQIQKAQTILDMVNRELNAPSDSGSWKKVECESSKAFVIVINGYAIAICNTDPITNVDRQARWMVHRLQTVVPNQVVKTAKVGISRIWVAPSWRRNHLAQILLEVVLTNSIFGTTLNRNEVAFSQPSHSGGLLAKKFNGVTHKSGELLIPVYLE
ncbi:N-acetyltransferase ECO1 (Establishment of cohesion protein 1), partial [Scheffersomyces stipitis CBS 6054]